MSLRDVELDVATLLQAAGLGSMSSNPPTLYAGPFPESAPSAMLACRVSGGEAPEKYLGGAREELNTPTVTVLVRGEPNAYAAARERAAAAWAALNVAGASEYVRLLPEDAGPNYLREDEHGRSLFSFRFQAEYLSTSSGGEVTPLPAEGPLQVPSVVSAGEVRVGAMPLADFPTPAGRAGALLFDSTAGRFMGSNGSTWVRLDAESLAAAQQAQESADAAEASASSASFAASAAQATANAASAAAAAAQATATSAATAASAASTALTAHTGASSGVHGVAGSVVGTTDAQVLSSKTHSGTFLITGVSSGQVALGIPGGSSLRMSQFGGTDRTLRFDEGVSYFAFNSFIRAPLVSHGVGQGDETASLTADGNGFLLNKGGRVRRQFADTSATPGNATANAFLGKSAIAPGASSVTIANNKVQATSLVRAWVQQAPDSTLRQVLSVSVPAAGSFTVYGDAAATAAVVVGWEILDKV